MGNLSNFIKNGANLTAKAGSDAINANDVLAIANNALWPCANTDFACVANQGAATLASTTVSANAVSTILRNAIAYQPSDGSTFVVQSFNSTADGCRVSKYLSSGALFGTLVLDNNSTALTVAPQIAQLSNGNYVAVWGVTSSNIFYAIFDQYLNQVVGKTAIDTLDANFHLIALSAGGFAVAYSKNNPFIAVYANDGSVVKSGAALTNAAIFGASVLVTAAQITNGNIAIAIGTSTAAKLLGYAIVTAAGANVLQCTMIDSGGSSVNNGVYARALSGGGFVIAAVLQGRQGAYVYNAAGALQGGGYTDTQSVTNGIGKLLTDGVNAYFVYTNTAGNTATIAFIPPNGTGFVVSTIGVAAGFVNQFDAIFDRGNIVMAGGGAAYVMTPVASGAIPYSQTFSVTAGSATGIKATGDFGFMGLFAGTLAGYKYANASICGISQQSLAAGNAGTVIPFTMGPGGYPANPLTGTVGKAFDHSASNIVANKGVLLSNGASLKGI
jgi:hypothetical protein